MGAGRFLARIRRIEIVQQSYSGCFADEGRIRAHESGYFAHRLNAYGRHGEPCPRCGTPIVRERFMNRSSHFCPKCQRLRAALPVLDQESVAHP
jgi:formamidopyrimidine-DNA glycosylase